MRSKKHFEKRGWKSKYNTPYQRRKLYDNLTDKLVRIQSQEAPKNTLSAAGKNLKIWRDNVAAKGQSSESFGLSPRIEPADWKDSDAIFQPIVDPADLFAWMKGLESVALGGNYYIIVYIKGTPFVWEGSYTYIITKATDITNKAKALYATDKGNYGGYTIAVNETKKEIYVEFTPPQI